MDRKTAEEFWTTYFGLIMHEGADTCMGNPFKEFIKEARIGTYDALTDDEYHVKLRILAEYGERAWGCDDIHNIREGDKIYIVGKLKFESLGNFKTTLDIPKDVNEVYFCSRKIWSRSNE